MILIYSISTDATTNLVIDWLNFFKAKWTRINSIDFGNKTNLTIKFTTTRKVTELQTEATKIVPTSKIAVWLRRYNFSEKKIYLNNSDAKLLNQINSNIHLEKKSVWSILNRNICDKKKWLNYFESVKISKPKQLEAAISLHINVPETIVTTSKVQLKKFFRKHKKIIIKPIETFGSYVVENHSLTPFTQLVDLEFINSLSKNFFPILCQKYIEKEFEIRSFFLKNSFYSTAMFTQRTSSTKVDSRNLDNKFPIRNVPYKINKEMEKKLRKLMKLLDLNSGSFDLIMGRDNKLYFLEVNPVGQFGFNSYNCNYHLERRVAEYLLILNNEK